MGYDIYLRNNQPACITCGHKPDETGPTLPEPTYNLTPIFDAALTGETLTNPSISEAMVVLLGVKTDRPRGLRLLNGHKGKDTVEWLEKVLGHLSNPEERDKFIALEPTNGWGTLDGATKTIQRLIEAARDYPENVWEVR
jgi:hypothetical protein